MNEDDGGYLPEKDPGSSSGGKERPLLRIPDSRTRSTNEDPNSQTKYQQDVINLSQKLENKVLFNKTVPSSWDSGNGSSEEDSLRQGELQGNLPTARWELRGQQGAVTWKLDGGQVRETSIQGQSVIDLHGRQLEEGKGKEKKEEGRKWNSKGLVF